MCFGTKWKMAAYISIVCQNVTQYFSIVWRESDRARGSKRARVSERAREREKAKKKFVCTTDLFAMQRNSTIFLVVFFPLLIYRSNQNFSLLVECDGTSILRSIVIVIVVVVCSGWCFIRTVLILPPHKYWLNFSLYLITAYFFNYVEWYVTKMKLIKDRMACKRMARNKV